MMADGVEEVEEGDVEGGGGASFAAGQRGLQASGSTRGIRPISCLRCRQRKTRCTGHEGAPPCDGCRSNGYVCTFPELRKRGPYKKKALGGKEDWQYGDRKIATKSHRTSPPRISMQSFPPYDSPGSSRDPASYPATMRLPASMPGSTWNSTSAHNVAPANPSSRSRLDAVIDGTGPFPLLPPHVEGEEGDYSGAMVASARDPSIPFEPSVITKGILTWAIAEELFEVFFRHCALSTPILDARPSPPDLNGTDDAFDDTDPNDVARRSELLFLTIAAVGCRFHSVRRGTAPSHSNDEEERKDSARFAALLKSAEPFLIEATLPLPTSIVNGRATFSGSTSRRLRLETIQAIMLLGVWLDCLSESLVIRPDVLQLTGAAVRLGLEANLNFPTAGTNHHQSRRALARARTWCCIFFFENMLAIRAHRPSSLPESLADLQAQSLLSHPGNVEIDHRVLAHITLLKILSSTLDSLRSNKNRAILKSANSRIEMWGAEHMSKSEGLMSHYWHALLLVNGAALHTAELRHVEDGFLATAAAACEAQISLAERSPADTGRVWFAEYVGSRIALSAAFIHRLIRASAEVRIESGQNTPENPLSLLEQAGLTLTSALKLVHRSANLLRRMGTYKADMAKRFAKVAAQRSNISQPTLSASSTLTALDTLAMTAEQHHAGSRTSSIPQRKKDSEMNSSNVGYSTSIGRTSKAPPQPASMTENEPHPQATWTPLDNHPLEYPALDRHQGVSDHAPANLVTPLSSVNDLVFSADSLLGWLELEGDLNSSSELFSSMYGGTSINT